MDIFLFHDRVLPKQNEAKAKEAESMAETRPTSPPIRSKPLNITNHIPSSLQNMVKLCGGLWPPPFSGSGRYLFVGSQQR